MLIKQKEKAEEYKTKIEELKSTNENLIIQLKKSKKASVMYDYLPMFI